MSFEVYQNTIFFREIISRNRVKSDPRKLDILTEMPPLNNENDLQSF